MDNESTITPKKYAPNLYDPPEFARREQDSWGVDVFHDNVAGFYSYDSRFKILLRKLGYESFIEIIDHFGSNGDCHVLDLMGGAYFLKPNQYQSLTSITGLRLDNPEESFIRSNKEELVFDYNRNGKETEYSKKLKQELQDIDSLRNEEKREVVYGSVYDKRTWRELSNSMHKRNIDSFNLVICRPQGPFFERYITGEKTLSNREKLKYGLVFDKTFREVLARVNKSNGMLFFQIPQIFDSLWINEWVKRAESKYGLKIDVAEDTEYNEKFKENSHIFVARYQGQ
jgi:hypothetical protein